MADLGTGEEPYGILDAIGFAVSMKRIRKGVKRHGPRNIPLKKSTRMPLRVDSLGGAGPPTAGGPDFKGGKGERLLPLLRGAYVQGYFRKGFSSERRVVQGGKQFLRIFFAG